MACILTSRYKLYWQEARSSGEADRGPLNSTSPSAQAQPGRQRKAWSGFPGGQANKS